MDIAPSPRPRPPVRPRGFELDDPTDYAFVQEALFGVVGGVLCLVLLLFLIFDSVKQLCGSLRLKINSKS